jgi:type III restriction enzyme
MFLKNYQIKVVTALKQFYQAARETKNGFTAARQAMPENLRHTLNWVEPVFAKIQKEYKDKCANGLKEWYPRIVLKVPTGGGKTLLAVEAIREYQNLFAQRRAGLVVWIVPTETIYTQTIRRLRDKSNYLRQLLDQCSGNRTLILEKGQRLTIQDIEENLVVLFVMIQSISRVNGKAALKVFQDSGGYESFFPADNRNDLHAELLRQFPNLDFISPVESAFPLIKTSLGNAIRVARPFIIIDEIHKVFSDMARHTIDNLNPECVLGLSATPKADMNVVVSITGLELKDEDMVKLDMHILPPAGRKENDWKAMVKEIKNHRENLEKKAKAFQRGSGIYIRPIALLQVEATGKDQRGKGRVHSLDVKDFLADLEVNPDEIAIKTSSQNDIEDVNLFGSYCPVRYIITKEALREGWDCSFAYVLGIIPNVNSDTSITQLIGRILRQPNAKKTGIKELDESYIYYAKGDTRQMIERVDAGFKNEGLEDLMSNVRIKERGEDARTKPVKIRKEFKKHPGAFYLPVWLMTGNGGEQKRRFSYDMDIKAHIDFAGLKPSEAQINKIIDSLSEETRERTGFAITLDKSGHTTARVEAAAMSEDGQVSIDYLTRRYSELIENPFFARTTAVRHIELVRSSIGQEKLREHFSYIASMLHGFLHDEKTRQEEALFLKALRDKKVVLAVSDDNTIGYQIPQTDTITVDRMPNIFRYYLFDDVELSTMNSLERTVGQVLDNQEKILWWFRNRVGKQWYAIQGWHQYKIRPDFVAAKKNDDGKLELVYIIESKGEHLLGNADSEYKKSVLDLMTEQHKTNRIERYQLKQLNLFQVNEKVECYFVEENKEEESLRKLFK